MDSKKIKLSSKEKPTDEEVLELRLKLQSFNDQVAGKYDRTSFMHQLRNESQELVGGVYGSVSWDWLHIDLLWVDENYRRAGAGKTLINAIEYQAKKRGIYNFHLSTSSFQALEFYKKLGYRVCGQIKDFPPGHTNYFLIKTKN